MEVTVIIEKTSTGYSAYAQDVDGIVTAAKNIGELKCYVGELKEDQVAYLREMDQSVKADKLKSAKINYHIDLSSFFEEFEAIDLQGFAKYIGIEEKYIQGSTSGVIPISEGFRRLSNELAEVSFA